MSLKMHLHELLLDSDALACERVGHLKPVAGGGGYAQVLEIERHTALALAEVDEKKGNLVVGEELGEGNFVVPALRCDKSRAGLLVLIYSDKTLVFNEVKAEIIKLSQVAAEHQRGREHTPERKLRLVVGVRAAYRADISLAVHSHGEHINVVEAAGSRICKVIHLA